MIDAVKAEKASRATFKKELNMEKKKISMAEMKRKLDDCLS